MVTATQLQPYTHIYVISSINHFMSKQIDFYTVVLFDIASGIITSGFVENLLKIAPKYFLVVFPNVSSPK